MTETCRGYIYIYLFTAIELLPGGSGYFTCKQNNIYIYLFTPIGLLPGGSGYFTCKQNMKLVTSKFKSGWLHEKRVVAPWNVGNHLSICL
jgi:hypothetical protein